ncbi:MAG: sulfatase [Oscillospiraceae bacterium]|nr:sulfatase [Oscillospiraceae bacterium]
MRKPNIILINCDDLGYGDLGCYGSTANKTPALDRMAAGGVRFTDFYMASPVCSPSRGAMMTGCYPPRIGFGLFDGLVVLFPGQGIGLNPSEITIASLLKGAGYATMHIGKWHCGDQAPFMPTAHGFDHYYGLPYSNDMGRQSNANNFPPLPLLRDGEVAEQQPDQASLTERYLEHSVRFIREHRDDPFFLYLAHMYVHVPHYAPERFRKQSYNGEYGACVECVDWCTDVILHELEVLGIDNDTLVIFTSDNGSRGDRGGSNRPLRGAKGSTFEGGMRVPCIMYWPGRIPAGSVVTDMAWSMDFYKTLAALGGAEVPGDRIIDGANILDTMLDPSVRIADRPFFYYKGDALQAVRYGDYKYDCVGGALYNLREDIGEAHDIAGSHPDTVARMEAMLAQCREDMGDTLTGAVGANIRPAGRVDDPKPLTVYKEDYPYYMAIYDKPDAG